MFHVEQLSLGGKTRMKACFTNHRWRSREFQVGNGRRCFRETSRLCCDVVFFYNFNIKSSLLQRDVTVLSRSHISHRDTCDRVQVSESEEIIGSGGWQLEDLCVYADLYVVRAYP